MINPMMQQAIRKKKEKNPNLSQVADYLEIYLQALMLEANNPYLVELHLLQVQAYLEVALSSLLQQRAEAQAFSKVEVFSEAVLVTLYLEGFLQVEAQLVDHYSPQLLLYSQGKTHSSKLLQQMPLQRKTMKMVKEAVMMIMLAREMEAPLLIPLAKM